MVSKLSLLPNTFTESKTASYFDNNVVSKDLNFELSKTSPEKILSIFNDLNPSKAAGIDCLSDKFLKYGAHFIARTISQLCYLSKNSTPFQAVANLQKFNLFLKNALRSILKTTALFHLSTIIKNY